MTMPDRQELEALVGGLRLVATDSSAWVENPTFGPLLSKAADVLEALLRQDMAPSGEQDQGLSRDHAHTTTVATPKSAATDAECVELKPCPFCGEAARESVHDTESLWSHDIVPWLTIGCDDCDFSMCSEVQDELREKWNCRALPDHQPSASGEGWRPIETAPRDGTVVVLTEWSDYNKLWSFGTSYWRKYHEGFGEGFGWIGHSPTHWMQLPAPPKPTAAEGGDRAEAD